MNLLISNPFIWYFLLAELDQKKSLGFVRGPVWLTKNLELSVSRDSLLCLIFGITAVSSHVVTCCQDQDQFSGHTSIKGCLPQCISHDPSVLKQKERMSHREVCVWSRECNTHIHTVHINLEPGQSPCGIPSCGEADETDCGPWTMGGVLRTSIKPYLLRGICCKWMNQEFEFW